MGIFRNTDRDIFDAFQINLQGTEMCIKNIDINNFDVHIACDIASRIAEQRSLISQMMKRKPRLGLANHMRKQSNRIRTQLLDVVKNTDINIENVMHCCSGHHRQSLLSFLYKSHKKGDPLEKRLGSMRGT